ncbi:hypothetical protein KAU34_06690 [candidate division WOR-3 bacterium]|nr:hypothetical protein [candidate division WOR-3 bacterium]
MPKKVLLHFFLFSFYFSLSYAQAPGTLWTKTYGGTESDIGSSVQQTSDGGYIIAGSTNSFGVDGTDVYLIKTDASGDTLWTRTYGGINGDQGYSVQQTSEGGYIVVGETDSFGAGFYDFYLVKTDSFGDTLWTKTYGGQFYESGESVQQTSDGGYIIGGYTDSFGAGKSDAYLVKTDANGDILWTKIFGGTSFEYGFSAEQTLDGGYIVTGYTWSYGSGYDDVYLIKTEPDASHIAENQIMNPHFATLDISPNPFSKTTGIRFQVSGVRGGTNTYYLTPVTLNIYDVSGRFLKSFSLFTAYSVLPTEVTWDGRDSNGKEVQSGIYFLKIVPSSGDYKPTKIVKLK